jgi:hypothetical protein
VAAPHGRPPAHHVPGSASTRSADVARRWVTEHARAAMRAQGVARANALTGIRRALRRAIRPRRGAHDPRHPRGAGRRGSRPPADHPPDSASTPSAVSTNLGPLPFRPHVTSQGVHVASSSTHPKPKQIPQVIFTNMVPVPPHEGQPGASGGRGGISDDSSGNLRAACVRATVRQRLSATGAIDCVSGSK